MILPDGVTLGPDIWDEMIRRCHVSGWVLNDNGSTVVPDLGKHRMIKHTCASDLWFARCFQTCVWLVTSNQGKNARKMVTQLRKGIQRRRQRQRQTQRQIEKVTQMLRLKAVLTVTAVAAVHLC